MRRVEIYMKIYNVVILSVYGCEIWSRTLKEDINCKYLKTKCPGKRL
jgi:hypothetical protein